MFKLALNAGHGLNTPGKRCLKSLDPDETKEYLLNKRICDITAQKLSAFSGIEILRIDDGSELSVTQRAQKANDFGADLYFSIHHNAGINGGNGGGIEVYTYLKAGKAAADWQKAFYEALIGYTDLKGNRAQPLRKANFAELRKTKMPAVLCECGFMDSIADTPVILTGSFAENAAAACAEVIAVKAGLKSKAIAAPSAPYTKPVTEIAAEVIKGLWGNGTDRKLRITAAGYDYRAVQARVNELLASATTVTPQKTNTELAKEVIAGKWGNGEERKNRLTAAGYSYAAIQKLVNDML